MEPESVDSILDRANSLLEAGKPAEFRLHVDGGGKSAPNDPRILNFRVFRLEAEPWEPASR